MELYLAVCSETKNATKVFESDQELYEFWYANGYGYRYYRLSGLEPVFDYELNEMEGQFE